MVIDSGLLKQLIREVKEEVGYSEWISPKQAASQLNVSSVTVRRWCESGSLPAKKFDSVWRIKSVDFKRFCEER
jgi:excisionase family DNA binding protein